MSAEFSLDQAPVPFPSTRWQLIHTLQDPTRNGYPDALDHFARIYWQPIYCFLRARGCLAHEAEELAQEFFLTLLEGRWIYRADPERGPFRVFLRMHLRSFLADRTSPQRARRQTLFERQLSSLDRLRAACTTYEPASDATPDDAFEQAYARAVVEVVREKLERDPGVERDWPAIFAAAYPEDRVTKPLSQQALAERFGRSRDQIRTILRRMKRLFLELLREELRRYAGAAADVATEEAELLALLAHARPWKHED